MKKPKYPDYIVTDAAKRLWDEKILMDPDKLKERHEELRNAKRKLRPIKFIKGYRLNGFQNRSQRRFAAKRAGYLKRNDQGMNGWAMYIAPLGGNVQTVINSL